MEQRKKELKEQYKQMKPEMGILMVTSLANNKHFLIAAPNLRGMENRIKFQLSMGSFPNRTLQQDWDAYGEGNFKIETLDTLEYSKDETKTDHREDLEELREIWIERFREEQKELY
ncbi:MAG: GIY-YIG nuclease family protein [Limnochordia bacterium]|jgi:hypothetical protein|nr:MAG: hypothetical protein AA931_06985 [Peptococcaceae bacterium 1109]